MSKEQTALQHLWVKAYRETVVTLNLPTAADARRLRFALYNAVRPVKEGRQEWPELLEAAEGCQIELDGERLSIRSRLSTAGMQAVLSALGVGEEELTGPETLPAQPEGNIGQSLSRLSRLMKETPPTEAPRSTPFYKRED